MKQVYYEKSNQLENSQTKKSFKPLYLPEDIPVPALLIWLKTAEAAAESAALESGAGPEGGTTAGGGGGGGAPPALGAAGADGAGGPCRVKTDIRVEYTLCLDVFILLEFKEISAHDISAVNVLEDSSVVKHINDVTNSEKQTKLFISLSLIQFGFLLTIFLEKSSIFMIKCMSLHIHFSKTTIITIPFSHASIM